MSKFERAKQQIAENKEAADIDQEKREQQKLQLKKEKDKRKKDQIEELVLCKKNHIWSRKKAIEHFKAANAEVFRGQGRVFKKRFKFDGYFDILESERNDWGGTDWSTNKVPVKGTSSTHTLEYKDQNLVIYFSGSHNELFNFLDAPTTLHVTDQWEEIFMPEGSSEDRSPGISLLSEKDEIDEFIVDRINYYLPRMVQQQRNLDDRKN